MSTKGNEAYRWVTYKRTHKHQLRYRKTKQKAQNNTKHYQRLVYVLKNRKHFFHAVQYDALRLFLVVGRVFSVNLLYHERTYLNKNYLENIRRGISRLNKAPLCITSNSDDQIRLFKKTLGPSQKFIRLHNPIINDSLKQDRIFFRLIRFIFSLKLYLRIVRIIWNGANSIALRIIFTKS